MIFETLFGGFIGCLTLVNTLMGCYSCMRDNHDLDIIGHDIAITELRNGQIIARGSLRRNEDEIRNISRKLNKHN
jgi:hypothetical protein